jgi:hypothetical protein
MMNHSKMTSIKSALKAIKSPIQALSIAIEKGVEKGGNQPFKKFNALFDYFESEGKSLHIPGSGGKTTLLAQFAKYVLEEGNQGNLKHFNEAGVKILSMNPDPRRIRTNTGEPLEDLFSSIGMHEFSNKLKELRAIRNHGDSLSMTVVGLPTRECGEKARAEEEYDAGGMAP